MALDFKKYERAFAFGCSFTKYLYPTWADLIFNEIDGKCYNFGKQGSGNLAIASRIAEANTRFKFTENDLVMVMYSSACREDRYIDGQWQTHGNLYQSDYYDKNFVKNYVDPVGHIIRDLGLIELSMSYVKSLPCDAVILHAFDILGEEELFKNLETDEVLSIYSHVHNAPSVESVIFTNGISPRATYIKDGKDTQDSHPTTLDYLKYLTHVGIKLSDSTYVYAHACERKIEEKINLDQLDKLYQTFPEIFDRQQELLF